MGFGHPLHRVAQRGRLAGVDGNAGAAATELERLNIIDAPLGSRALKVELSFSTRPISARWSFSSSSRLRWIVSATLAPSVART